MNDLNADIVLCEDGRTVVAMIHRGEDEFVRAVELGQLDQPTDDDHFDDKPWRARAASLGASK